MQRRVVVYYRGRVQGVGFRYNAYRIAQRHAVAGFVHNLPDGRVHLVAEGSQPELRSLLDEIALSMAANIQDTQEDFEPPTGEFKRFEIT